MTRFVEVSQVMYNGNGIINADAQTLQQQQYVLRGRKGRSVRCDTCHSKHLNFVSSGICNCVAKGIGCMSFCFVYGPSSNIVTILHSRNHSAAQCTRPKNLRPQASVARLGVKYLGGQLEASCNFESQINSSVSRTDPSPTFQLD